MSDLVNDGSVDSVDKVDNVVNDANQLDDDLISILTESSKESESTELSVDLTDSDKEDADRKMEELRSIAKSFGNSVSGRNPGSGDIDVDLSNWFDGVDSLPSDSLSNYVSNSEAKMMYGLSRNTLSSYSLMGKLGKFLDSSMDMLFSDSATLALSPSDLLDRVKVGFAMYKELGALNQRTLMSLKEYKFKSGSSSDEVDKLTMLLSSIPSDKLEDILSELNKRH